MRGGEGCGSGMDGEHLEPPKPVGATAAEHEALNRGAGTLRASLLLCPCSCSSRGPQGSPGQVPAARLGWAMGGCARCVGGVLAAMGWSPPQGKGLSVCFGVGRAGGAGPSPSSTRLSKVSEMA